MSDRAARISGMKTKWMAVAIAALALTVTGCSANPEGAAMRACVSAAEEKVDASISTDDLSSTNFSDAMYEAGITSERDTDTADGLYTVVGDFTFEKDGTESRRSMLCTVKIEDGEMEDPDLTVTR